MRDEDLFYLYALLHVRRREELGLSLSEAAKRTRVSPQWMNRMETLQCPVTGRYILRSVAELGLNLDKLRQANLLCP